MTSMFYHVDPLTLVDWTVSWPRPPSSWQSLIEREVARRTAEEVGPKLMDVCPKPRLGQAAAQQRRQLDF